jgi:hypothetical protein
LEVVVVIKRNLAIDIKRIIADEEMTEMERLAAAFGYGTESFIMQSGRDLELARAMGDEETAVKEQIKSSVMQSARELFEFCYLNVTGTRRGIWDEQDES